MSQEAIDFIAEKGIQLELGPVERTGARRQSKDFGDSIYFRDPDQNLLEFISYRDSILTNMQTAY